MKNNLPLIILAFVVVIGAALWFSRTPAPTAPVAVPTIGTTTETSSNAPVTTAQGGTGATPAAPAKPTTGGIQVGAAQIWKAYRNPDWDIVFDYNTEWNSEAVRSEDGKRIDQIAFSGKEGNIRVSREIPIANPAGLTYETSTRTIAGKEVNVREYKNPNEIYEYYLSFTLPVGNKDYYVSISSFEPSKKFADVFIKSIELQ